jgi:hypothetical protein
MIDALVEKKEDPFTNYGKIGPSYITRKKQRFQYAFVMEYPSDTDARVVFRCGEAAGDITIDNVSLIYTDSGGSGLADQLDNQPGHFTLSQNHPNPFNPETWIRYDVPEKSRIRLSVYSVTGQRIADLVDAEQPPGHYSVLFDGRSHASGVYYYQLKSDSETITRRMVLMK